jgi:lysophospholipase L1-like esterase
MIVLGNGVCSMKNRSTSPQPIVVITLLLFAGFMRIQSAQALDSNWVGTWAVSPMRCGTGDPLNGETLRQVVHTSVGGRAVRIHLSNLFGTAPLIIDDVRITRGGANSSTLDSTERRVPFHGVGSVAILPGSEVVSDPVRFRLSSLSNVTIDMHVAQASRPATCHQSGFQTNHIAYGNVRGNAGFSNARTTNSYFYLSNVDIENPRASGALVAMGASITDGYNSTANANLRWPNDLAQRLVRAGISIGVLNQGISGNRLLAAGAGESAETRFDRDVLAQPGVRWVIFSDDPINDLGSTKPQPTADQLIAGLRRLIARAHAKQIQFLCSTLTPYEGANYWTALGEAARDQINNFIHSRESGCDAVVDEDMATHDPEHPSRYLPVYDSGDHLHPNNAGLQAIADSVPFKILAQ